MKSTHRGVQFDLLTQDDSHQGAWNDFRTAAMNAVILSEASGEKVYIDVAFRNAEGARWWGGDAAQRLFENEPEARAHVRISVQARQTGMVK